MGPCLCLVFLHEAQAWKFFARLAGLAVEAEGPEEEELFSRCLFIGLNRKMSNKVDRNGEVRREVLEQHF